MSDVARRRNLLMRNRTFRRMWTARAISFIGDGIAITALVLHVGAVRGTGTAVGALLLAQALPHLLGPMTGVIADRTDQRRLMIACNLGNAVVFGIAAWWSPELPGLLVLVAISSTLDTMFGPAGRSAIPALVDGEDLLSANAWLGTALNMQVAIGPLLGGLFVATLGFRGAMVADAASFLLSAAWLLGVRSLPPDRSRSEPSSFLADTREGLAYVRRQPVARAVVVTLFIGVAFAGIDNVALVFLSRDVLGAGPLGFGVVAAAFGMGMLVASVALSGGRSRSPRTLFIGGWLLTAAGTLLTGLAPAVWLATIAQAIGGAGNGADNVASDTLIQRSVPRELLGRVFGVTSTAAFVGGGIAYAAGGPLLDATSPRFVFLVASVGVLAVVGLAHVMLPRSSDARGPGRRPGRRGRT
jgi:MFS family permease